MVYIDYQTKKGIPMETQKFFQKYHYLLEFAYKRLDVCITRYLSTGNLPLQCPYIVTVYREKVGFRIAPQMGELWRLDKIKPDLPDLWYAGQVRRSSNHVADIIDEWRLDESSINNFLPPEFLFYGLYLYPEAIMGLPLFKLQLMANPSFLEGLDIALVKYLIQSEACHPGIRTYLNKRLEHYGNPLHDFL